MKIKPDQKPQQNSDREVTMTFSENKYYNDYSTPHFETGKEYVLKGEMWIQRWLKRGGTIVAENGKPVVEETPVTAPQADQIPETVEPVAPNKETAEDDHKEESLDQKPVHKPTSSKHTGSKKHF